MKKELTNKFLVNADEVLILLGKGILDVKDPLVNIAVIIKETLVRDSIIINKEVPTSELSDQGIPGMLVSCRKVFTLMKNSKINFSNATHKVALEKNVQDPTIRQSCCRALGLTASDWNQFYFGNTEYLHKIKKALYTKYKAFSHYIDIYFN